MTNINFEVANAIRSKRDALLRSLRRLLDPSTNCADAHILRQFETAIELLTIVLTKEGARKAGQHFGGWVKIAFKQSPGKFIDEPFAATVLDGIWLAWTYALHPALSEEGMKALATITRSAEDLLRATPTKTVRALFIGDCLLWDASLHLQICAQAEGVAVEPTIMAQRLGSDLRRELLKAKESDFNLVVFSPYTYVFSGEYAFATSPLNFVRAPLRAARLLDESLDDVKETIDYLAARFECPVYVHNVSGARQSHEGWCGMLKYYASSPARALARRRLNRGLSAHIDSLNRIRDRPIMRIDENQVCSDVSLRALGLIAYNAGELHPTQMAAELARTDYLRAVRVQSDLVGKKLIVSDLDNTLWEGTIGEGAVCQHLDRQQLLLSLKARGIVLAVASKNDPKIITWRGALLSDDDFVAKMVNWNPKQANILAIAEQLNLKPSSFVFLDDRQDEREMVASTIPGLIALDPNEPETWNMLRHWADTIPRSALQDRTKMYYERAQREEFLNSIASAADEIAETYKSLKLRLSLRHPDHREIIRMVELINRTNQFNTTGVRTTKQEMTSRSGTRRVLIADVRDKFGDMGIVGVLVVELGAPWRITHFVLSCRVFGYGIEDAMLNAVKRWNGGIVAIDAPLVKTPANGPCQDVYARNGFACRGESWVLDGSPEIADPSWLAIEDATNPVGLSFASAAE